MNRKAAHLGFHTSGNRCTLDGSLENRAYQLLQSVPPPVGRSSLNSAILNQAANLPGLKLAAARLNLLLPVLVLLQGCERSPGILASATKKIGIAAVILYPCRFSDWKSQAKTKGEWVSPG